MTILEIRYSEVNKEGLISTLPTVINKDLCPIPAGELKIKTKNDFDYLRSKAEDRTQRKRLSANIQEAAKAFKSEH